MADILLAEKSIVFVESTDFAGAFTTNGLMEDVVVLVAGNTYTVMWDGVKYECVARNVNFQNGDEIEIGNANIVGIEDNSSEPFVLGYSPTMDVNLLYMNNAAESHTIAIYNGVLEEDTNKIFSEQTLNFEKNSDDDIYSANAGAVSIGLIAGETYTVFWDGVSYECVAEASVFKDIDCVIIGNKSIESLGDDTGEPFVIGDSSAYSITVFETLKTHTIAIYKGVLEEDPPADEPTEEEKVGANIVLFDRNGNKVIHEGIETVTFNTDVEDETATYTLGTAVENVPIELDFSKGNQTVDADVGKLIKSIDIQKPSNLIPENIRKDEVVAGIKGTLIGEGVSKTVDADFSEGNQIVLPDPETLLSEVVIVKPENLVPENVVEGVAIAGVIGTYPDTLSEFAKIATYFDYTFDIANKQIILTAVKYDAIYADTGSYDVNVPGPIGSFAILINAG